MEGILTGSEEYNTCEHVNAVSTVVNAQEKSQFLYAYKTYRHAHMNALLSECLGDAALAVSGDLDEVPESISVVVVRVKGLSALKKPRVSQRIPPPQAENVPQRMQVRTDAAEEHKI